MNQRVAEIQSLKSVFALFCLILLLTGCQTKMAARQAQRDLKTLVDTSKPIFEHDHVALLYCGNLADHQKIKDCITQTQRAVDMWFGDTPRQYISRLLIFSPDEPLGKRLVREMHSATHVAGNTEARTHTILVSGYPSQDSFWTTLRHELTHDAMLRHYDSPDLLPPFWITEGLATSFETDRPHAAFGPDRPAEAREEELARAVENTEVPRKLRRNPDAVEEYKTLMAERAKPIRNKAIASYAKALSIAREEHWFNKYSQRAENAIAQLDLSDRSIKESRIKPNRLESNSGLPAFKQEVK